MNKLRAENFPYKIAMPKLTEQKKRTFSHFEERIITSPKRKIFFFSF